MALTQEMTLQVKGMDCAGCAQTVEKGVSQLPGVSSCSINFSTEKLRVTGEVSRETVAARVRELGYEVAESQAQGQAETVPSSHTNFFRFMWQRRETQLALLGLFLIIPGLLFEEILGIHHPLINLFSMGALVTAGGPVARSAWRSLRINREININVLMTIAGIGALLIGEYTEAGLVMVLFALGEALEGYTGNRAREAIRSLFQVVPNQATVLQRQNGHLNEARVGVEALQVGDIILVKPGERIPMDGRVTAGASAVNQAPITGESQLVEKEIGSEVFASSINGQGTLEIRVTHLAADNTISRMIQMVEEAQEKRAPVQRFVDRFAKYYTPVVVALAGLVAIVPPLFFGQPFFNPNEETFGWLYRGLALLVVACPCALVISAPVTIISAISNGARSGILIKGGAYLEALSRVKGIAFDKTGTLTEGKPAVVAIRAVECRLGEDNPGSDKPLKTLKSLTVSEGGNCEECTDLLALASALERRSEHPLAHAIVSEAQKLGVQDRYPAAEGVSALAGRGVTGQVAGRQVTIGSHTYFDTHVPHTEAICALASQDAAQGHTPMLISVEGKYLGYVTVADTVRQSSRETVQQLKQMGLKPIVMLTGDNRTTAHSVAEQAGVTEVRAELLPEDKVAAVEALQAQYGEMVMVGDGINDAPALATARVGIAMGSSLGGTAQAMETADITLMGNDLRQLPFLFRLSRTMMGTIRANVVLSIGIKLVFLVLVLFGLGTMWMAVLADMGTSLLVTLNGMRLLRWPDSRSALSGFGEGTRD